MELGGNDSESMIDAIGKDYWALTSPLGVSPSGSGVQITVSGLLGFKRGWGQGESNSMCWV